MFYKEGPPHTAPQLPSPRSPPLFSPPPDSGPPSSSLLHLFSFFWPPAPPSTTFPHSPHQVSSICPLPPVSVPFLSSAQFPFLVQLLQFSLHLPLLPLRCWTQKGTTTTPIPLPCPPPPGSASCPTSGSAGLRCGNRVGPS